MAEDVEPVVQRRRVASVVRQLRTKLNLTQTKVAADLEWSHAKLVRIERGTVGISATDLRALLAYYGVDNEQQIAELLNTARAGRQLVFTAYADVLSREYLTYLAYELAARTIRKYEASFIPGLLQTPDYIHATQRMINPGVPEEIIERRAKARIERQELLRRNDRPELHIIMDEAVVRRQVGLEQGDSRLMLDQLAHIQQATKLPGVKVQVLPFAAGAHPGMAGPFTLLDFPDPADPSLLYVENTRGDTTTRDDPHELQRHLDIFFALQKIATRPEETAAFLEAVAHDLRARTTKH